MARKQLFKHNDVTELDISHHQVESCRGTVLLYPGIGLTTRLYEIPFETLEELKLSCIEYHPPAHGRSRGHMTMENALSGLENYLSKTEVTAPLFIIGHSAGANACIQYFSKTPTISLATMYLVQPVFSFAESARYMYHQNNYKELFEAIKQWVTDPQRLEEIIRKPDWLNRDFWEAKNLKTEIDSYSQGILLGDFLEDFYISDNDTHERIQELPIGRIFLSSNDSWYEPEIIRQVATKHQIALDTVDEAKDHFFRDGWTHAWKIILNDICMRL